MGIPAGPLAPTISAEIPLLHGNTGMCLIAIVYRVIEGTPLLIGVNREEFYQRGGEPPRLHHDPTPWIGGHDPVGGGTWLGVNAHGLLVAVTNRPRTVVPDPRRSRGVLVRELLRHPDAAGAVAEASHRLQGEPYDGCNLLIIDALQATVLHAGDWLRVRPLPPGIHVLANADVNDEMDPRVRHVRGWLASQRCQSNEEALAALATVCAQTEPNFPPICLRKEHRGTVSSSLLALRGQPIDLAESRYLHSQGPPDRAAYEDRGSLLRELSDTRESRNSTR